MTDEPENGKKRPEVLTYTPAAWRGRRDHETAKWPRVKLSITSAQYDLLLSLGGLESLERHCGIALGKYLEEPETRPLPFNPNTGFTLNTNLWPEIWAQLHNLGGTIEDHLTTALARYLARREWETEECSLK